MKRTFIGWISCVLMLLAGAFTPASAQLAEAGAAFEKEDYTTAYRLYGVSAAQGLAEAQHRMGVMHKFGWGAERDHATAAKWFQLAAAQGHAAAQSELAIYYKDGRGVPRDLRLSAEWFTRAAEQGVGIAQLSLGRYYLAGTGVERDAEAAYYWLTRAGLNNYMDGYALRGPLAKELGAEQRQAIEVRAKQATSVRK